MTDNPANYTAQYERDLTPAEIEQRKKLRDKLDDERDDLLGAVEQRRREIRALNASRKKIEARILDIRREIRSGTVLESRQVKLAFPEPPEPDDPLSKRYPLAKDAESLHSQLCVVLDGVLVPSIEKLEKWHPDSGVFFAVSRWARSELAHMNAKAHPDLKLPPRTAMPVLLSELRIKLRRAGKKKASKAPARKAKARPAEGTPIRTGQGRRRRAEARP